MIIKNSDEWSKWPVTSEAGDTCSGGPQPLHFETLFI